MSALPMQPPRTSRRCLVVKGQQQLRVCTHKTCKRQGSQQVAKHLQDLTAGRTDINITECGCLGNCGAGPNIVLLPAEQILSHVATPSDAAEVLSVHCGIEVTPSVLQATMLRSAGNAAAMEGDLQKAIQLYTQGLDLNAPHSRHLLLSNRSAALLQLGKKQDALSDAQEAVQCSPHTFTTAWVRLIDCLYATGDFKQACDALRRAETECIGFKTCREYKSIIEALKPHMVKVKGSASS